MNKKLFLPVMPVCLLAFGLLFVSCGGDSSKLAGVWEAESDGSTLELVKDGTGSWDGFSITWKTENNRLVVTGGSLEFSYDYKLSGSTLTLTDDDDTETYKKK